MNAYTLIWQPSAVAGLLRVRGSDPHTAKTVRAAIGALALDPGPRESAPLGARGPRRMRLGEARVLCTIDDDHRAVQILMIGKVQR